MKNKNLMLGIGIMFLLILIPVAHASILDDLWYWIVGDSITVEDKVQTHIQHNWYTYPHYQIQQNCYSETIMNNNTHLGMLVMKACTYNDVNLTADAPQIVTDATYQDINYNGYSINTSELNVWCWKNDTAAELICLSNSDGPGMIHKEMMPTNGMSYFIIDSNGLTKEGHAQDDFAGVKLG